VSSVLISSEDNDDIDGDMWICGDSNDSTFELQLIANDVDEIIDDVSYVSGFSDICSISSWRYIWNIEYLVMK
jgi:hypothetical protein